MKAAQNSNCSFENNVLRNQKKIEILKSLSSQKFENSRIVLQIEKKKTDSEATEIVVFQLLIERNKGSVMIID